MKVLDVDLFQVGLQRNITMLDRLRSEIEAIHRAVDGLVQMEDQLKGEGGNAIRSFYGECHLPFLQYFQLFSENFKQVLHQMEAALHSLEPNSAGYILEQFLEGELEQGLTLIGQLTANLTDETNSIMDQVSDIVGLPHLDDSVVQEGVVNSKRERDDTVTQLHEFDLSQTTALTPIEQDMQTMETWLADLEGLFKDGLTDIHFQTNQWASLASCNPLLTDLTTSANSDIDSPEVENENDTIVDTGVELVKGVGTGLYDAGKDFVVGLWDTITNPKATVEGLVNAVTNPIETYNTIKTAISQSYERDMVNGDANSRGHWVAYAIGTVATSIVGTKGANALVKTGTTAARAAVPKVVFATNNASSSLANLLPYTPRPQLAMAGEIPYNVVNGVGLKDQLFSMAKITSGVNGAGKNQVTSVSENLVTGKHSTPNKITEPEVAELDSTKGTQNIENFKVKNEVSAEEVNKWWKEEMGYDQPPYKTGTVVKELLLTKNTTFVRVYDGENSKMYGGWFMEFEDIKGLNPKEIQEKFALPYTPKYIADLKLEEGTIIRNGIVNPLFGYKGGGTQFDLMGQYIGEFGNERLIGGVK